MERDAYKVTLEAARVNAGLSRLEASRRIGISVNTIASYETGRTSPTVQMLKTMCRVYNAPIDSITFVNESH